MAIRLNAWSGCQTSAALCTYSAVLLYTADICRFTQEARLKFLASAVARDSYLGLVFASSREYPLACNGSLNRRRLVTNLATGEMHVHWIYLVLISDKHSLPSLHSGCFTGLLHRRKQKTKNSLSALLDGPPGQQNWRPELIFSLHGLMQTLQELLNYVAADLAPDLNGYKVSSWQ